MARRSKDGSGEVVYTSVLGRSTATELVLQTLFDEGKLESLANVRAPGAETTPAPRADEAVVFVAFFDAGLRIPCVKLVSEVLQLYGVELAQLTPNSIVKLGVFEWLLRAAGSSAEGRLFAYLHDGRCQPKKKKNTGETLNFGSVNFQAKTRCQMYLPAPAARNRWDTEWTRRWFYHTCPSKGGLHSRGGLINLIASPVIVPTAREEALLLLLLDVTKRLSTRDLVEEFCAFGIWPLAQKWSVEVTPSASGRTILTVAGRKGDCLSFSLLLLLFFFFFFFFINKLLRCDSCSYNRGCPRRGSAPWPVYGR